MASARLHAAAVALALVLGLLPACGGDDDDDGGGGGGEPAATSPPAEQSDVAIPESRECASEAASRTLEVAAVIPGKILFDKSCVHVKAGRVTVRLRNDERIPHNVRIEKSRQCCKAGDARDLGGTGTITNEERTDEATVRLEAGTYWFFCAIGGHWQRGMGGTLIVD
jgi:plastocyanin